MHIDIEITVYSHTYIHTYTFLLYKIFCMYVQNIANDLSSWGSGHKLGI